MLRVDKYIDQISHLIYVLAKIESPYVPDDFPLSYAHGKDIDILVTKQCYAELKTITLDFFMEHNPQTIEEPLGARIRINSKKKLHFQFDISHGLEMMKQVVFDQVVNSRVKSGKYFVPSKEFEMVLRSYYYIKKPRKTHHLEWIKKNMI